MKLKKWISYFSTLMYTCSVTESQTIIGLISTISRNNILYCTEIKNIPIKKCVAMTIT